MVSTARRVLAMTSIACLSLTACGGSDDKPAAPASSSSSATVAASSAASSSSQAATQAASATSSAASTPATVESSSSAPAAGGSKAYTAAQLNAMIKGLEVAGAKVELMPDQFLAQARDGKAALKMAESMNMSPAACQTASVQAAKALVGNFPLSMGGNKSVMVILRSMPSAEAARTIIENNRRTAEACANASASMDMEGTKLSIKSSSKVVSIDVPSSDFEVGQTTVTTGVGNKPLTQTVGVGQVGNVLIQVTSLTKEMDAKSLSSAVEQVAKGVSAKK